MTILSEVLIETPWWMPLLGTCSLCGLILFVYLACESFVNEDYGFMWFSIAMLAWSIFGLCRAVCPDTFEETYRVEALVSEDVSFIEVNEEYKFIEQRGDIYVFETKEVEEE